MQLRSLEQADAPLMLEWMHDEAVVRDLQTDFARKTLEDCRKFIETSHTDKKNLHLAITDEHGSYMGTVSLKHIGNRDAEFGITIRSCAMGKGYSGKAMEGIFRIAVTKYGLHRIYWCVNPCNARALRFYDKNGYQRMNTLDQQTAEMLSREQIYTGQQISTYVWYEKILDGRKADEPLTDKQEEYKLKQTGRNVWNEDGFTDTDYL